MENKWGFYYILLYKSMSKITRGDSEYILLQKNVIVH